MKTAVERIEHVVKMVRNTKERAPESHGEYYSGYNDGLVRAIIEIGEADRLEKRGKDGK